MRKSTIRKIYVMAAAMLFTIGTFAQQEGVTMLPLDGATGSTPISLILDIQASCPDSSLYGVDSVMMHSGATIDETAWASVVAFDAMGANGQQPKLIPFSPGAQVGNITMTPISVYDQVNVVVWPNWTYPAGGLIGADSVMMHSGLEINGQGWQKVVDYDKEGANGQKPKMTAIEYMGQSGWMFSYIPADFYGVEEGDTVTAINCVFNVGNWDDGEGKDYNHDGSGADFRLQFSNAMPYKYSITFVPKDFYPIEDGQVIGGITCVFNGGAWDGHEGKAHKVDEEGCEDFMIPLGYDGIWTDKASNTFKLFPNPVGDVLNVSKLEGVSKIEIFNVAGMLISSVEVDSQQVSVNTSNLAEGMYVVSFHTESGIQTSKFIKN